MHADSLAAQIARMSDQLYAHVAEGQALTWVDTIGLCEALSKVAAQVALLERDRRLPVTPLPQEIIDFDTVRRMRSAGL